MITLESEKKKKFNVTKLFTQGYLKGISITENTNVKFRIGFECKKPFGISPYKITKIELA
jgi:hypothetical protein